jgi:hypothetical protein
VTILDSDEPAGDVVVTADSVVQSPTCTPELESCSYCVPVGAAVSLTAAPAAGADFNLWNICPCAAGNTSNPCTFTLAEATQLECLADFDPL